MILYSLNESQRDLLLYMTWSAWRMPVLTSAWGDQLVRLPFMDNNCHYKSYDDGRVCLANQFFIVALFSLMCTRML